ncbi:peptidoglycan bridge formation glycyltransferase FemA/FemB family protein [Patescibacteria group bacterium]|nr:peptidoglycan bridge formation glycyltransferase FemA/FemB family protein [Patescibacteria group bacterium]
MEVKEIQKKEIWEEFLEKCEEKTFLQSWNWGEFQIKTQNKIWRLGIGEENDLSAVCLLIKIEAKRGNFLFIPHGPIIQPQNEESKEEILKILLSKLKEFAVEEKVDFIRISPIWENSSENIKIFQELGFRKAPIHMHPELDWELDISSLEQEILAGMRKTTRYLIKQALKNSDIEIIQSQDIKDVDVFDKINQETVKRHNFTPFSSNYLKNQFSVFAPDNQIAIFFGKFKEEIVASGIFIFWQGIAFYHHGASSLKYSKIPIPYLLQWEAIKEAKKRGCKLFNFWGIAPEKNKSHPWAGLSLFKKGFGGYEKEYVSAQDFPISNKYWLTFIFEKLRKIKRRL